MLQLPPLLHCLTLFLISNNGSSVFLIGQKPSSQSQGSFLSLKIQPFNSLANPVLTTSAIPNMVKVSILTWIIVVASLSALDLACLHSIFNTTAKVILYNVSCHVPLLLKVLQWLHILLTVKSQIPNPYVLYLAITDHNHFSSLSFSSSSLISLFPKYTKSFPALHIPLLLPQMPFPKMIWFPPSSYSSLCLNIIFMVQSSLTTL